MCDEVDSTSKDKASTSGYNFILKLTDRGTIKQMLLQVGWPVKDEVVLADGEPLDVSLRQSTLNGSPLVISFKIRQHLQRHLLAIKVPVQALAQLFFLAVLVKQLSV